MATIPSWEKQWAKKILLWASSWTALGQLAKEHSYESNKQQQINSQTFLHSLHLGGNYSYTKPYEPSLEMRQIIYIVWIIHLWPIVPKLHWSLVNSTHCEHTSTIHHLKKISDRLKISVISRNSYLTSNILLWIRKYFLLLLIIIVFCDCVLKEKSLSTPRDTYVLFEYSA